MRNGLVVLWMLLCSVAPAMAQVSIGISFSLYPEMVPIQGYPVYYAPRLDSNYFFYDGMYWIYQGDDWYASSWYNGPWMLVAPEAVPLYILRVPVRYYRHPPTYFHGWRPNAPPRWDEHWGSDWSQRRHGWDRWSRNSAPPPAPLPAYQRKYTGDRYPQAEHQQALQSKNYRYRPRDPEVRQHYQAPAVQSAPAPAPHEAQGGRPDRITAPQAVQHPSPPPAVQQSAPPVRHAQPPQRDSENVQRPAPPKAPPKQAGPAVQEQRPQPQPGAAQHQQQGTVQQQEPKSRPQERARGKQKPQESEHGQGAGQGGDHEKAGAGGQEQGGAGQEHKR